MACKIPSHAPMLWTCKYWGDEIIFWQNIRLLVKSRRRRTFWASGRLTWVVYLYASNLTCHVNIGTITVIISENMMTWWRRRLSWWWMTILMITVMIDLTSAMLLRSASNGARGKAETKMVMNPNWKKSDFKDCEVSNRIRSLSCHWEHIYHLCRNPQVLSMRMQYLYDHFQVLVKKWHLVPSLELVVLFPPSRMKYFKIS